jgi:hypothetical protein
MTFRRRFKNTYQKHTIERLNMYIIRHLLRLIKDLPRHEQTECKNDLPKNLPADHCQAGQKQNSLQILTEPHRHSGDQVVAQRAFINTPVPE